MSNQAHLYHKEGKNERYTFRLGNNSQSLCNGLLCCNPYGSIHMRLTLKHAISVINRSIDNMVFTLLHKKYPWEAEWEFAARQGEQERLEPNFITLYETTRHYGGPEEGGWWYNVTTPLKTKAIPHCSSADLKAVCKSITEQLWKEHHDVQWGDIYSVNGGLELDIYLEEHCGENTYNGYGNGYE